MKKYVNRSSVWILLLIFILATQLPTVYAFYQQGTDYRFGGFLVNPIDGNSYLAKMAQGWDKKWLFQLPYTATPNQPALLFLFYLFLGNLSRWLNLELIQTFHLTRLLNTIFMFLMLMRYFRNKFNETTLSIKLSAWALFGAGLGWIGILFNRFYTDFWLAEAYPFLSALANPHFPLSIALILWMFDVAVFKENKKIVQFIFDLMVGLILVNISPFSVILIISVYTGLIVIQYFHRQKNQLIHSCQRVAAFLVGSTPFLGYQYLITKIDPILHIWNEQNNTPTPNPLLFIIGFIPVFLWAIVGIILAMKNKEESFWIPGLWVFVELVLIYLPTSLQRRFSVGLYIPLVIFAGLAYRDLSNRWSSRQTLLRLLFNISIGFSVITNIVILFTFTQVIARHDGSIFLSKEEYETFQWINANLPEDKLILAGNESGLFIPVYTHLRVLYGHPYESAEARYYLHSIDIFYSGKMNLAEQITFLQENSINYILWGYREKRVYSTPLALLESKFVKIIYQNSSITIYQFTSIY